MELLLWFYRIQIAHIRIIWNQGCSSVVNGALTEIYGSKYKHTDEYLCLRSFPQDITDAVERKGKYTEYRKDMISETGISVFMFGNKRDVADPKKIIDSDGCWEEFTISRDSGNIIIPIGSTGYVAMKVLKEVKANIRSYPYLKDHIDVLETETDADTLVAEVLKIIDECK